MPVVGYVLKGVRKRQHSSTAWEEESLVTAVRVR